MFDFINSSQQVDPGAPMQHGWKRQVLFVFTFLASLVAGNSDAEQFDEELVLKPLRDGKVAATFTFSTLLKGASPRDPSTLDLDDECNVTAPCMPATGTDLGSFYSQLNIIHYSLFHWAKSCVNMQ